MSKSNLSKFTISKTAVQLAADELTREEFLAATREYIDTINASKFKIGDFLNLFRDRFGSSDVQGYLITHLRQQTGLDQVTFDNAMSMAKHCPPPERADVVPASHYQDIQALTDTQRRRMVDWYVQEHRSGRKIPQGEWRQMKKDVEQNGTDAIPLNEME